ncbi:MAG: YkgJ family cysteine cluster protein [Lachnospiraceae bacterium]|nr:YkgJ family cysteine cluster protein [Lachnospiraceae bacterium]
MDAKLYTLNDMVRAGCNDCRGCSDCCRGMGESIVLDPYDIWQLENNLNTTFAGLMRDRIEFHVEDGLILPNLKMQETSDSCAFLDLNGRCGIHGFRPGLCRLFPLGRKYENNGLYYFLLEDACTQPAHTKLKVKKWLEITDGKRYEKFLVAWHDYRKKLKNYIAECSNKQNCDELIKDINMKFLHTFYEKQYSSADFYVEFEERINEKEVTIL